LTYFDLLELIRAFADVVVLIEWVIDVDLRLWEERELYRKIDKTLKIILGLLTVWPRSGTG